MLGEDDLMKELDGIDFQESGTQKNTNTNTDSGDVDLDKMMAEMLN